MTRTGSRATFGALPALLVVLVVAACGGGGQAATLVTYQRVARWFPRGGDGARGWQGHDAPRGRLERLTITADRVAMLRQALAAGLPKGNRGDSVVRTVTLGNGTTHSPVRAEPGSSVGQLEVLMTTHSLSGLQAEGVTPPAAHSTHP